MADSITPSIADPKVQSAYGGPGATPRPDGTASAQKSDGGPSFSEFMEGVYDTTKQTLQESQQTTMAAAQGNANVQDVVEATADAQLTVDSMVSIRDKAVEAYKQILRMPI